MTAPVLMLALWTVASLMRPGHDQLGQYCSELGTGPNAIVMNTNFVITVLLIVGFAIGLFANVHGERGVQIGSIILGIFQEAQIANGFAV
jgi:hypothetical membrane protein